MSDVRKLIRTKLAERGLSMSAVSKEVLGKNHAYLHQFLEQGVPIKLPEEVREKLAPLLGVAESELRGRVNPSATKGLSFVAKSSPGASDVGRLGVLGMNEGGPDGWSIWVGDLVDTIPMPPNLAGAPNAYAVYITGESMSPRFRPGELAHIHPGKPVTVGAYVLVLKKPVGPDEPTLAVIKQLVKRSGNRVTLSQHNPDKTFELKADEIVSMHRVVGSSEP